MKKKRLPIIEGALKQLPYRHVFAHHKQLVSAALRAKRFYLTEDASIKLGTILGATEDFMLDNHQFAVPAFETMYVELNARLMYEAANKGTLHRTDESDEWIGILVDKGRIWIASLSMKGEYGFGPWMFEDSLGHASMPFPKGIAINFDNLGPVWSRMVVMLGTGIHHLNSQETFNSISARFSLHPSIAVPKLYLMEDTYDGATGDLRNFIAVMLVLNTPQHITYITQPPTHGLVKGKRITFKGHSVVNIELGKSKVGTRFFNTFTGIKHRRHEVRGHYVHYDLINNCTHDWPNMPEDSVDGIPRWRCRKCRGMRVWRKEHQRGDATLGWVNHTYKVTT